MITDFNLLRLYFDVRTLITLINYGGNKLKMIIFLRDVFVSLLRIEDCTCIFTSAQRFSGKNLPSTILPPYGGFRVAHNQYGSVSVLQQLSL